MSTPGRWFVGLPAGVLLIGGGILLLFGGIYGWTVFVVLPVALGGLASWVFRPATGGRAAGTGACGNGVHLSPVDSGPGRSDMRSDVFAAGRAAGSAGRLVGVPGRVFETRRARRADVAARITGE